MGHESQEVPRVEDLRYSCYSVHLYTYMNNFTSIWRSDCMITCHWNSTHMCWLVKFSWWQILKCKISTQLIWSISFCELLVRRAKNGWQLKRTTWVTALGQVCLGKGPHHQVQLAKIWRPEKNFVLWEGIGLDVLQITPLLNMFFSSIDWSSVVYEYYDFSGPVFDIPIWKRMSLSECHP